MCDNEHNYHDLLITCGIIIIHISLARVIMRCSDVQGLEWFYCTCACTGLGMYMENVPDCLDVLVLFWYVPLPALGLDGWT